VALMRSRYAAYSMGLVDYIVESTHRSSTHYLVDVAQWKASIESFCNKHDFIGLTIEKSESRDEEGSVQFTAHLMQKAQNCSFREHSTFRKCENGFWKYFAAID
jgi:SEC-C motif domain protein